MSPDDVEDRAAERDGELQAIHHELKRKIEAGRVRGRRSTQIGTGELDRTKSPDVDTAVSDEAPADP